jgi:hypothetical protein
MNLQFSEVKLYNPGVITTRIPVRVFAELTADLQRQVDRDPVKYNYGLAGHLETELKYLIKDSFKKCLELTCDEYRNRFNFYPNHEYIIDSDSWVNFQKRHEYNPLHFHYQDISWVLWVSIPYELEDEVNASNVRNANSKFASKFQFVYNKLDGGIESHLIDINKSYEGVLIMFPSYLKHQVYPFQTSNEHRISIAGNIKILNK